MLVVLGPNLHHDPVLMYKIMRLCQVGIKRCPLDAAKQPIDKTSNIYHDILTILDVALLPSLSFMDCNCCVAEEVNDKIAIFDSCLLNCCVAEEVNEKLEYSNYFCYVHDLKKQFVLCLHNDFVFLRCGTSWSTTLIRNGTFCTRVGKTTRRSSMLSCWKSEQTRRRKSSQSWKESARRLSNPLADRLENSPIHRLEYFLIMFLYRFNFMIILLVIILFCLMTKNKFELFNLINVN